jgi:ParB family chromosome partitioning protein
MSTPAGRIELERTVDSITVGRRHRTDLGDLDALAASIERDGLLQPPTITPDGTLVCGARRLAAIKQLGHRRVSVWVRSGISDRLGHLLAEQDDNHAPQGAQPRSRPPVCIGSSSTHGRRRRPQQGRPRSSARSTSSRRTWTDSRTTSTVNSFGDDSREQAARMVTGSSSLHDG